MSKTKKEQTITINDKEYKESDLSQEQIAYINHINDLNKKIVSSQFNLDQLSVGKSAFMNALNTSLEPVA